MNTTLLTAGIAAMLFYCAVTAWLWRCYAIFYARYCYFPDYIAEQFPSLSQLAARPNPTSEAGIRAIKSSMPQIERDIRTRSGSARGFSPMLWWIQRVALVLSITFLCFSRVGLFVLLIPLIIWLAVRIYFHARGWRWLQHACEHANPQNATEG
jgi:hypothetical protein